MRLRDIPYDGELLIPTNLADSCRLGGTLFIKILLLVIFLGHNERYYDLPAYVQYSGPSPESRQSSPGPNWFPPVVRTQ